MSSEAARLRMPPFEEASAAWRFQSACLNVATRYYDPWDPPEKSYYPPRDAQEICESCPVRRECLIDAIKNDECCVRGGLTKRQRDALKRPRQRKACPVCSTKLPVQLPDVGFQVCVNCGISWRAPKTVRGPETSRELEPVQTAS